MKKTLLSLAAIALLSACGAEQASSGPAAKADLTDTAFNPNFSDYLKTLSSDEFGGREPASKGGELTVSFIENYFKEWGLQPYNQETGSYRQEVPLMKLIPYKVSALTAQAGDQSLTFNYRTEMTAWTPKTDKKVTLEGSDIVFVGYGIVAPEYHWNDYAGLDVKGKTVVMLVNDPGYATGNDKLFNGNAMTYYGRWTYKYEEAMRQGAKAAFVIHETGPAGYGWGVVAGGSPVRFALNKGDQADANLAVEGWITADAADQMFKHIGSSLAQMKAKALEKGFQATPLNLTANMTIDNKVEFLSSNNVVGFIKGSKHPEQHVLYVAHWDHLGTDPIRADDPIYNGAQDNATGTAGLMAIAEKFAKAPQPERSIVFVAVTAEEQGLLGSEWYANHPMLPLGKAVAGINMDVLNVYGPMRDMVMVGYGNSELDDIVQPYLAEQGRYLRPEPTPEKGFFYRSDHFNFAKKGVPMLYAEGGIEHVTKGKEYGEKMHEEYINVAYHKPADEYDPNWDLRGAQQDLAVYYAVGRELANSEKWPAWTPGNEFEAIRQQSAEMRDGK
ncbi:peptidase M28 [Idiomarina tyrosinivorans]|uniref:Peptidase M28 n=1 Tax=Idiomarina tyrosinivorans TaxID=1445662 RepID=A0A432ZTG8_9GAMM|nr:M28 family metallopeptidase [Idiomarina tyrosinivorans]RUO81207.1 peptidase M28 [Idiomarina tyrosinivorans]